MEKDIVVPEGMYEAALAFQDSGIQCEAALRAALRWLMENPIVPTMEQAQELYNMPLTNVNGSQSFTIGVAVEWQRRMFLVPQEQEMPREETMTEQQLVEVLERQVKVLSRFVHAMMSLSPIQADEFEMQMEAAALTRSGCDPDTTA